MIDRRKFRSEIPDNMDTWKSRGGKSQKGEETKIEDSRGERVRRKKMEAHEKVGKSRLPAFFPLICGSRGSKGSLAKAAGAEPCGQMRDKKMHAIVARSTFPRQNAQSTTCWEHFWKLRCRKSARCRGAKHMSNSKCTKHHMLGAFLEVEMSKKCKLSRREAHFQVKMHKAQHARNIFES